MVKIYNPAIKSHVQIFDGNKELKIPTGETKEFTLTEATFLLGRYPWLIEVNSYIPTEFRNDSTSEIIIFKKYWKRFKNDIGLRRDEYGTKYIIVGNKRFEIPNPETRNVLGYDISDFPKEHDLINLFNAEPGVTNVINARIVGLKDNPESAYIVFESPRLEKRLVPDLDTLGAIRRKKEEVEYLNKIEFDNIPTGEVLRSVSKWDSKSKPGLSGGRRISNQEEVFKLAPEVYGIGINLKALWRRFKAKKSTSSNIKVKDKINGPKKRWKQPEITISLLILLVAIVSIPWWPRLVSFTKIDQLDQAENGASIENSKILDRSVFSLISVTDYSLPILEVQKRWKEYMGLKTQEERAIVINYQDAGQGKTWVEFKSIGLDSNIGGFGYITCIFSNEWRQRIQLLARNESVTFLGTVRGDLSQGLIPILEDCVLK